MAFKVTDKVRDVESRIRVEGTEVRPVGTPQYIPGSQMTFLRGKERWTFDGGKIFMNGYEVNGLLNGIDEISLWLGIAAGLVEYKKQVELARRREDNIGKFAATVDALLEKILGKMQRVYNEKIFGLSWKLDQGDLVINGINIRSFLSLYRIHKTDKATSYLRGIREKLGMMLADKEHTGGYERIRSVIEDLYREIKDELGESNSHFSPPLLSRPPPRG